MLMRSVTSPGFWAGIEEPVRSAADNLFRNTLMLARTLPVLLAVVIAGELAACRSPARTRPPMTRGFISRTVVVDGVTRRFQVFVPQRWEPGGRWPVILFLHGSGEQGDDGVLQTQVGLGPAIRRQMDRFPAIVVFPQAPKDSTWKGHAGRVALRALEQTIQELDGDPTRVYLTGVSMGGYGTWQFALEQPTDFAALVPICGGIRAPPTHPHLQVTAVDVKDPDPYASAAKRLRAVPTWIFHGSDDAVIPVTESRQMAEALKRLGAPVRYTEYPGVNHNSWDAAYAERDLWQWLWAQRKH